MKNKVLWAFSLVLFLLVTCTFLSLRVEDLMTPVVTRTAPDFRDPRIDVDALFVDDTGFHLFYLAEGTGWEQGTRAYEADPSGYTVNGDKISFNYGGSYVVQYTAKSIREGEIVRAAKAEKADDLWLATSETELPPLQPLPENYYSLVGEADGSLLVSGRDIPQPFMEDRAKSVLFGKELVLADPDYNRHAVYSLGDVETFLNSVLVLAVLGGLLLFSVLLWAFSYPYIRQPKAHRRALLVNGGLLLAVLISMPFLLRAVILPSSLLPKMSILELGHYRAEFARVFAALEAFASSGRETARQVLSLAGTARWASFVILCGGAVLAAVVILLQRSHGRKKGRHSRTAN